MTKLRIQVSEFHRVFDHPIADRPTIPPDDRVRFRLRFIVEEALEAVEASFGESVNSSLARRHLSMITDESPLAVDLPKLADAFADIDYVVEGARIEFGIDGEPIADEVHRANMTKAERCICQNCGTGALACINCGGKGYIVKKRADGKTLKPEGWTPPDVEGELRKQGWKPPGEFTPQPIHTPMPAEEKLSLLMRLVRDAEAHQWSVGSIIQLSEAAKK